MSFENLGLRPELLSAVTALGYTIPTPIQAGAIPVILKGRDILAGAQTGTGKTAAFTLPMLQQLSKTKSTGKKNPRALVLTPTRELAAQVADSVREYGQGLSLRSAVMFGGVNIKSQIAQLRNGVDILVATPGRLLDHAGRGTLDLSGIEMLVLDEADRMLDMGFIHDIRRVMKLMPKQRQNMMFSATYSTQIKKLADTILHNPVLVEVAKRNTAAASVTHRVHEVARDQKRFLLAHLIKAGDWQQVLIFTRTKHGANRLTKQLKADGVTAAAIHGNKSQATRTKALDDFKQGNVRTLVATDIAARGLDIVRLPFVVNFDLPHVPEDYVHRIGRTGRAGEDGIALSLVCPDEQTQLAGIQRLLQYKIPVSVVAGFRRQQTAVSVRPAKPTQKKQAQRPGARSVKAPATNRKKNGRLAGEWFEHR